MRTRQTRNWLKKRYLPLYAFAFLLGGLFMPGATPQAAAATCSAAGEFVTTWDTTKPGITPNDQIRIPTTGSGYGYRVDINGDGDYSDTVGTWSEATNRTGVVTIGFATPGVYTVRICGAFPRMYLNNSGDAQKLIAINQWGDNAWTSMSNAFYGASNLDVVATDTPNLSVPMSVSNMFRGCQSLVGNAAFNAWDVSNVTNMAYMFNRSSFNQPIDNWNTGNVNTMLSMFGLASAFNQPLDTWNVENVTNMSYMFSEASAFNQPLDSWDTASATNLSFMFSMAPVFNQPLNNWDTAAVTTTSSMFYGATSFNGVISDWDTSSVTNFSRMFLNAHAFNQPLDNWNTSSATNMNAMFRGASSFNQPLGSWDVARVTSMIGMFGAFDAVALDATTLEITAIPMSFNQPLNSWDTTALTDAALLFGAHATAIENYYASTYTTFIYRGNISKHPFNQSLGSWNMSNTTNMQGMLSGSSLSRNNYDITLIGWAQRTLQSNVRLGADGLQYCDGQVSRQAIVDNFAWAIQGDTYDCSVPTLATMRVAKNLGVPKTGSLMVNVALVLAMVVSTSAIGLLIYWRRRWVR